MVYRAWGVYTPLDPDCPENPMENFYDDPMTQAVPSDVVGDISKDLERKHREKCQRCKDYGLANLDVEEPW